jgi:hypothetical protein
VNLPPDIKEHLQAVSGAALAHGMRSMEGLISSAVGQPVYITSGPAGQIVIAPKRKKLPKNPAKPASDILLPLLLGSAVLALTGKGQS